tara:strand:+ start:2007 stop:6467 length:4461 start_codon:yes stop_codon:yes gene_type:complete
MKINRNFLSGFSAWVALSVVSILFFQNCGQQGDIALKMEETASDTLVQDICAVNPTHVRCTNAQPTGKVEEYRYIDVSQPVIPDLKIFLVLDNSDSMRVSQVNLVNNIEKMFSANSQGLADYNSEIFILTTAQLNNIGNSLFRSTVDAKNDYQKIIEKIYEISSVQFVQSMIEVFRPAEGNLSARKTSGLLEGDMVGFKLRTVRAPSSVGTKYDVLNSEFSPAYLTHVDQPSIVSVKYSKGESIQDLVNKIKARVEFLDPDKQFLSKSIAYNGSTVDNVPLSEVVEKESGLCAMARVLHEVKNNPENSLIKKGELATFILVSDEKEHDPQGLECVKSYKFQQPVPGFLYKGECADTDSNVSYAIPSNKTVTFKVKKPYTRHVLWAYESIQPELAERMASCDIKFNQSLARLKVLKNTHVVTFDRKVVDSKGDDVVDFWKHDLKFDRVNIKHNLNFTRTTLKHKINFNRTSQKYAVTGKRTHTAPKYAVDIKRKKVAKYQRVNYKRETILKKEGNQTVVVETYTPPSPIRVSNVNFASISQCTQDWLRTVPAVYSLEKTLSANESYKYTVTECVINNDETADNKVVEVVGVQPAASSCSEALAKGVYSEGTLAANESFTYLSVDCLSRASIVTIAPLNIAKDGVTPSASSCTPAYASSIDSSKPSVDSGKGETLVYSEIACNDASTTANNVEIANLSGAAPVSGLLDHIKTQDGNRSNTSYSNYSATDTNVVEANQSILVVGAAPSNSTDIHNNIVAKDGKRANTLYSSESASSANVVEANQAINGIDGKYDSAVNGALNSYIATKDGKTNVSYDNTSVTNKATYKASLAVKVTVDGKAPATCDVAYASNIDNSKPALSSGQSLVYSKVSCSTTSSSPYQIVRNNVPVKYDGGYGHKAVPYESDLGADVGSSRACSDTELSDILAQESAASPALNIDGNILVPDLKNHCRVYNSEVTWTNANKTKILNAINSDSAVKYSTNASQCETAIASYCTGNATNNPNSLLACENKPTTYVSYRAYKPEYRKYSLKPPVKPADAAELHWFGFEQIVTKNKAGQDVGVNLLNLTCAEVPGACVGATAAHNSVVVGEYFKQKYSGGNATDYAALAKVARSANTVTDSVGLVACNGSFMTDYSECRDKSVQYSNYLSYDSSLTDVAVAKAIDAPVSCDDLCTADSCKTKDASSFAVPYTGKTMNQFYNNACSIGSVATTGSSVRSMASVRLTIANSDSAKYQHDVDVCSLTCAESGLCKLAVNSEVDNSQSTVRQYIAMKNQNMDPAKVASCKMVRKASVQITGKSSFAVVENECTKPSGIVLPNKYVRSKVQYYDADPSPSNEVKLVRENEINLENYIKNSFDNVLGDGYVSMIAFANQSVTNGVAEGADYNRIAQSVGGQIRDVKADSSVYGDALKFLGEKVAAQLASSFKVVDIDPSQQITRVWYSSWFTKGKFIELSPTDYTASANSFVITNPDIVNKIKNEAAFKFFVEIY